MMKSSEFAKAVVEMIQSETETFKKLIENEDWEALEDQIFEYTQSADQTLAEERRNASRKTCTVLFSMEKEEKL